MCFALAHPKCGFAWRTFDQAQCTINWPWHTAYIPLPHSRYCCSQRHQSCCCEIPCLCRNVDWQAARCGVSGWRLPGITRAAPPGGAALPFLLAAQPMSGLPFSGPQQRHPLSVLPPTCGATQAANSNPHWQQSSAVAMGAGSKSPLQGKVRRFANRRSISHGVRPSKTTAPTHFFTPNPGIRPARRPRLARQSLHDAYTTVSYLQPNIGQAKINFGSNM